MMTQPRQPHHHYTSIQPVRAFKAVLVNNPVYPAACRYQFKTVGCKFKHRCRYAHYSFTHEYLTPADEQQQQTNQQLKVLSEQVKVLHDMVKRMGHAAPSACSDSPPSPITAALSFDTRQEVSTTSSPPKLRTRRNKPKAKKSAAQQQQLRSTPFAEAPTKTVKQQQRQQKQQQPMKQSQAKSTRSMRPPQSTSNANFAKKILNALSIDDDAKIVTAAPTTTTAQTICASATSLSENAQTQTQMQTDLSESLRKLLHGDLQPTIARNSTLRIDDIDVSSDDERKKLSPRNSTDSSDVPHSLSLKSVPPPTTTTTTLALKPIAQRTTQSVAKTDCDDQSRLTAMRSKALSDWKAKVLARKEAWKEQTLEQRNNNLKAILEYNARAHRATMAKTSTKRQSTPRQLTTTMKPIAQRATQSNDCDDQRKPVKPIVQCATQSYECDQRADAHTPILIIRCKAILPPQTRGSLAVMRDIKQLKQLLDSPMHYVELEGPTATATIRCHFLNEIHLCVHTTANVLLEQIPDMPRWSGVRFNGRPLTFSITTLNIDLAVAVHIRRESFGVDRVAEQKEEASMLRRHDVTMAAQPQTRTTTTPMKSELPPDDYDSYNDDDDPYSDNSDD